MFGEAQPFPWYAAGECSEGCTLRLCGALPGTAVDNPGCTSGFPAWGCLGEQAWLTACTRSFQVELGRKPSHAACWQCGSALALLCLYQCVTALLFPCKGICLLLEPTATPALTFSRAAVLCSCDNWTVGPSKSWGKSWSMHYLGFSSCVCVCLARFNGSQCFSCSPKEEQDKGLLLLGMIPVNKMMCLHMEVSTLML